MDMGPFPMAECLFCGEGTMIPKQVKDETRKEEEKKST